MGRHTIIGIVPAVARRSSPRRGPPLAALVIGAFALIWPLVWSTQPAVAQYGGWITPNVSPGSTPEWRTPDPRTAVPPQTRQRSQTFDNAPQVPPGQAMLALEALLTSDSPPIDRGLVWRVFRLGPQSQPAKLVKLSRDAQTTLTLEPGQYAVNAAFGRAYLTQIITLNEGRRQLETFVLNAGGLKVTATVAGANAQIGANAHYDIYSDERDQSGERRRIVSNVRPGLITRLNSGIYHIVSWLGDANARVAADVAVEAGKLTEAVVAHEAGKATFKLVKQAAGEAHADTQWVIMTQGGEIVKESAGALPSHLLAPGGYSVSARWGGKLFTRTFDIGSGDNIEVEVIMH